MRYLKQVAGKIARVPGYSYSFPKERNNDILQDRLKTIKGGMNAY